MVPNESAGRLSQFSNEKFDELARRSLLSARHWGVHTSVVIPRGDYGCEKLVRSIPSASVFHISINAENQGSWVKTMLQLKLAYMTRTHFAEYVYFEMDMLILPGASMAVQSVFSQSPEFDVAYTYNGHSGGAASLNTGIVLYRRTQQMFSWHEAVTKNTAEVTQEWKREHGRHTFGGQNQVAIDRIGAQNIPWGTMYEHNITHAKIFSMPRKVLNGGSDCCDTGEALVLHFRGMTKKRILDECCDKYV